MAVLGRRPDQRRGEEVRGVNLPYPFCPNLPYLFRTYPILTLSFLSKLTLAFFHVRGELTLSFFNVYDMNLPYLSCARGRELPYPILLGMWQTESP